MESTRNLHPALSLLVVEDDTLASRLVCFMIAKKFPDVTIYQAENGRVGVQLFKDHSPQIVVTDIRMPEMDGIAMAREIRSVRADTKLIVLTGCDNEDYLAEFRKIGFSDYILKPVNFKRLFPALQQCIDEIRPGTI